MTLPYLYGIGCLEENGYHISLPKTCALNLLVSDA